MKKIFAAFGFLLAIESQAGVQDLRPPVDTVNSVDLQKYLGRWYEIAAIPQSFQKKCIGNVKAEYASAENGLISVLIAAVARCFPGKAKGGADRVPDAGEIKNCGIHLREEMSVLKPKLILAVGKLAITEVLGIEHFGPGAKLIDVVGTIRKGKFHGQSADVICLPHPSGLSSWPKVEPGKTLLSSALALVRKHPEWKKTFHG